MSTYQSNIKTKELKIAHTDGQVKVCRTCVHHRNGFCSLLERDAERMYELSLREGGCNGGLKHNLQKMEPDANRWKEPEAYKWRRSTR